ncbi:WASP homolog-associated protein with actin, membranes and microtubules [Echinops telfairi]|uniref:WASP homolog-associated protein with actin, membranes and microtubules n=1 Tax=Echinops telfairi TaxID=9371 RepID=A0ABM0IUS7_ECHTE|nr:WASP homolog-associated protein with actin, membranes and microtubules [Echinops telfairi]
MTTLWSVVLPYTPGILQGHDKANTMVALMKVYQEEDEAYQELVTMATAFYQYLLQPFRDMREVATSCKLDILKSLAEDELGPKRIAALQKEAQEWTRRAEEAVVSIQDITVNYFKETVKALAGMQKQMERDARRFGQAAWAAGAPRFETLRLTLTRETLQLGRARELCLNHRRAEIWRKMEDLPEQEKNINVVDELEIQYYEVQLELYEVKFEILKYEETLLITQLESIKRLIKEKQEEVVYYDTCESPEELGIVEVVGPQAEKNVEEKALRRQAQQLEARRGRICARRAYLRNRKDQCKENHRLRVQRAERSVQCLQQHHSIQMKRDKSKEEEQQKKEWINQERQKTLQRLRAFKEPPPPLPAAPFSCPAASPRKLPVRTSVREDQPLPLVCEPLPERPRNPSEAFKCPGSMDEVLASLRSGRSPLQKVEVPAVSPPCTSVNEHILAAIRQGVKLKKVHPDSGRSRSPSGKPTSDLERSIQAALQRIKRVSADSEEEGDEQNPSDWDQ